MDKAPIFVALDFQDGEAALSFLKRNNLEGVPVKVGMELFFKEGPRIIEKLKSDGHPVFLDLKLFDIPNTVKQAMKNIGKLDVDITNVHALGGREMIAAAKEGLDVSSPKTKLIAVTILTSMDRQMMNNDMQLQGEIIDQAKRLADISQKSRADGVVCSVHEANAIKDTCGSGFMTVTPGIRLANSSNDDQKRVATPAFARKNGADFLVIGRSITKANNPGQAYEQAVEEWENGQ